MNIEIKENVTSEVSPEVQKGLEGLYEWWFSMPLALRTFLKIGLFAAAAHAILRFGMEVGYLLYSIIN